MSESSETPIVLVCGADDRYSMPLAVTVRSAAANLGKGRRLSLYLIDGGIRRKNKERIGRSADERTEVKWLKPDLSFVRHLHVSGQITSASYLRILIPDLLPPEAEKAIYLDSDTVVLGDLERLWDILMEGNPILAARDAFLGGRDPDGSYFNSGVLVFDLGVWRKQGLSASALALAGEAGRKPERHDQDALNAVCRGRWGELDPRWNQQTYFHYYGRGGQNPFLPAAYRELIERPHIVHYATPRKPWLHPWGDLPGRDVFFEYLDQTAWAGWRPTVKEVLWKRIRAGREERVRAAVCGGRS